MEQITKLLVMMVKRRLCSHRPASLSLLTVKMRLGITRKTLWKKVVD